MKCPAIITRAIFVSLAGLCYAGNSSAATFTVNTTIDAVDSTPGDGACSTATGACSLRAAVQEANALAGADIVALPAGTFRLNLFGSGEDASATGDLDVLGPIEVQGAGSQATTVDGVSSDRVFHVLPSGSLILSNFAITKGFSADLGGGIYAPAPTTLEIENMIFSDNRSQSNGGAIYVVGTLSVSNGTFDSNVAFSEGGAIYREGPGALTLSRTTFLRNSAISTGGALFSNGPVDTSILDSTFSLNSATNAGGAVFLAASGNLAIGDSSFSKNAASNGGALFISGAGGLLNVSRSSFEENKASSGSGGVVFASGLADTTILESSFTENASFSSGGVLFLSGGAPGSDLRIANSQLQGNTAQSGPGGAIYASLDGTLEANAADVSANFALSGGGGIFYSGSSGIRLTSSTVRDNISLAGPGGGIFATCSGAFELTESAIENNVALDSGGGAFIACSSAATISRSGLSNNSAYGSTSSGGGVYFSGAPGTLISDSTLSGNSSARGGALFTADNLDLVNVTMAHNLASLDGSSIYSSGGTQRIRNSIIGYALGKPHCFPAGGITSQGNNIVDDTSCFAAPLGSDQQNVDPKVDALASNGGNSQTNAPQFGSPAIDALPAASCSALDQRGVARPFDGNQDGNTLCDIGAHEYDDACPLDGTKQIPGVCGCGVPDIDDDADGTLSCLDGCPADGGKVAPGACGCGVLDSDSDADGTADCNDSCPSDGGKTVPGVCGCGVPDADVSANGILDCLDPGSNFVPLPATVRVKGRTVTVLLPAVQGVVYTLNFRELGKKKPRTRQVSGASAEFTLKNFPVGSWSLTYTVSPGGITSQSSATSNFKVKRKKR